MEFKLPFRLEDSNSVKVQHIINRIKNLEASGVNVINFALDETDLGTPKLIRAAAGDALLEQQNDYQPFDPEHILKKEICDYIDRTRGFRPKLEQILVGPGIKPILFCILFSILKSPNEIISTDPGSYIYNDLARITGSKIKYIKLDAENNYKISLIKLTKLLGKKTKAILLNSPQNPIGNVITNTEAQDLSEVAKDTDTIVISDETYSQIVYDGTHVSPATFDRATSQTIMLEELSCTFSMQGWGLGFCVGPIDFIEKLHMVTAETLQPVPDFIQYAGIKALSNADILMPEILSEYKKCCITMVSGLNELPGFYCPPPTGGVHVFPDISGTKKTGMKLAEDLLENAGIAVLPGEIFGKSGKNHVRLSFATAEDNINESLIRLKERF